MNASSRVDDGVLEFEYAVPLDHVIAAAEASRAAGTPGRARARGAPANQRGPWQTWIEPGTDDGPPAAVLHLEGAEAIDPDLESLELWYGAGLRSLGPVWSRANAFGWGVPFISPSSPDVGPGLTYAGRALVRRCAELGIVVDLSHLNEAGFWDVARLEVGPLVASHAAVHALCPTSRNLTDHSSTRSAPRAAWSGSSLPRRSCAPDFADDPDTPIELIAEHARYAADRIGVRACGAWIGLRWRDDPGRGEGRRRNAARPGARCGAQGFTEPEIDAIAWANWRRVLAAWWRD